VYHLHIWGLQAMSQAANASRSLIILSIIINAAQLVLPRYDYIINYPYFNHLGRTHTICPAEINHAHMLLLSVSKEK
jgi:hypothetical protein